MKPRASKRWALTLVELLIVVVLISIVAAMVLSRAEPSVVDVLVSAGRVLAADLDYTRELAISNNSTYQMRFETSSGDYFLEHSGTNPALDKLPVHPYLKSEVGANSKPRQRGSLRDIPAMPAPTRFFLIQTASTKKPLTAIEFGPTGQTTVNEDVLIWLACGTGSAERYLPVRISAATGSVRVGDVTATAPTSGASSGAATTSESGQVNQSFP
jgi:type II secretory pathway pseudopilin PulG